MSRVYSKNNANNKKGFTLVEMLVTISILGLITVVAIPLVENLQGTIRKNRLESYEEVLIHSAKLYVSSKSIDLFGYENTGCAKLYYSKIRSSNMIEDIPFQKDFGLNPYGVFVQIQKNSDKYTYKVYLNNESISGCVDYRS